MAQCLLYVPGVSASLPQEMESSRWRLRKLKALGCFAGKNSAFIVPGVDLCQQIECGIQYTLSRSSPIAASLAAHGKSGDKKMKNGSPEEETWYR